MHAVHIASRMSHRRQSLCEQRAYPIGVRLVSTECGAAVTLRVTA